MITERWNRLKRFYKRNDVAFAGAGVIIFMHILWWEVQQNRAFVKQSDRKRTIGPFTIPYLDELDFFKKKAPELMKSNSNSNEPVK